MSIRKRKAKREVVALGPKIALSRVYLNAGGYDSIGSYWGIGQPLYAWTMDDPGNVEVSAHWSGHIRAATRGKARLALQEKFPGVRFYA